MAPAHTVTLQLYYKNKDKALIQHEDKTSTKWEQDLNGGTKPRTEKTAKK